MEPSPHSSSGPMSRRVTPVSELLRVRADAPEVGRVDVLHGRAHLAAPGAVVVGRRERRQERQVGVLLQLAPVAEARVREVLVILEPVHARRHLGVAAVHVLVHARAVESERLVPREERAVRAAARRAHRDEVDAAQTGLACEAPRDVQQLLAAAGAQVALHPVRAPDGHHGLAVDLHVLRVAEVVVDPVARDLLLVRHRMRSPPVVVRPHEAHMRDHLSSPR